MAGGGNPWAVTESGVPFAAGPHTLLFYAPTSLVPLEAAVVIWMTVGIAASAWLVRRLGLPAWWLLFPPLAHAMWNANPQTVALALLVAGGPIAAALAVAIKLYCGVPLLWRWRDAIVAGLVLLVTLPLVPWQLYLAEGLGVSSHLETAWNGSACDFRSWSRQRSSRCGSCGAAAPSGSRSRRSGPRRSSTTWRWRSRPSCGGPWPRRHSPCRWSSWRRSW